MKAIYKVGVLVEGNEFIEEFIFDSFFTAKTKFREVLRDAMMNGPSVGIVVMREYLLKGEQYECTGDVKAVDLEDFDRDALALERANRALTGFLRDIAEAAGIDKYAAPETYAERIASILARASRPRLYRVSDIVYRSPSGGDYTFHLTGFEKKIETIKSLRDNLDIGLKEAKDFVEGASAAEPAKVFGLSMEVAEDLLRALHGPTGGKVYINNPKLLPESDDAAGIAPMKD